MNIHISPKKYLNGSSTKEAFGFGPPPPAFFLFPVRRGVTHSNHVDVVVWGIIFSYSFCEGDLGRSS